ncbi:MAG: hypothetical protein ACYC7D_07480 [Nitrososphaerales archaeon]
MQISPTFSDANLYSAWASFPTNTLIINAIGLTIALAIIVLVGYRLAGSSQLTTTPVTTVDSQISDIRASQRQHSTKDEPIAPTDITLLPIRIFTLTSFADDTVSSIDRLLSTLKRKISLKEDNYKFIISILVPVLVSVAVTAIIFISSTSVDFALETREITASLFSIFFAFLAFRLRSVRRRLIALEPKFASITLASSAVRNALKSRLAAEESLSDQWLTEFYFNFDYTNRRNSSA